MPVTAQLPGANGYTGGKVIFIDTEVPIMYIRKCFELPTIKNVNLLNKREKLIVWPLQYGQAFMISNL